MSRAPAWAAPAARVTGFVLLAPVGFLYLVSGLVVPMPWLFGLWVLWIAFVAYAIVHRHEPWHVLATPVVAVLVWVAILTLATPSSGGRPEPRRRRAAAHLRGQLPGTLFEAHSRPQHCGITV